MKERSRNQSKKRKQPPWGDRSRKGASVVESRGGRSQRRATEANVEEGACSSPLRSFLAAASAEQRSDAPHTRRTTSAAENTIVATPAAPTFSSGLLITPSPATSPQPSSPLYQSPTPPILLLAPTKMAGGEREEGEKIESRWRSKKMTGQPRWCATYVKWQKIKKLSLFFNGKKLSANLKGLDKS